MNQLLNRIWKSRLLTVVTVVVVMLLLFWLFSFVNRRFFYFKVWEYLAEKMEEGWLLPQDLANAIAALVWIPFLYFLKESAFPKRHRRTIGLAGVSAYFFVFFAVAYAANRDTHFGKHGTEWVALTQVGCIYADKGGVDPKYGTPRIKVTRALVEACERASEGEEPCLRSLDLIPIRFNPDTQQSLVWFVKHAPGDYCFYMTEGVDTQTGDIRRPLTPNDVIQIQRERQVLEAEADRARQEASEQERREERAQLEQEARGRRIAEERNEQIRLRSELDRYVNTDLVSSLLSSPTVLVAARSFGARSADFENLVADELSKNGIPARASFLRSPGYSRLFEDLKSGDVQEFQALQMSSGTLKLLIIELSLEEVRETGIGNTYKADGNISGRLIGLNGNSISSFSFAARGAGFHPADARAQVLRNATDEIVIQLVEL